MRLPLTHIPTDQVPDFSSELATFNLKNTNPPQLCIQQCVSPTSLSSPTPINTTAICAGRFNFLDLSVTNIYSSKYHTLSLTLSHPRAFHSFSRSHPNLDTPKQLPRRR